jgi:hypothetical protein
MPRVPREYYNTETPPGELCAGRYGSAVIQAELAKLTPARLTLIMNLLGLAPDIQEESSSCPPRPRGGQR